MSLAAPELAELQMSLNIAFAAGGSGQGWRQCDHPSVPSLEEDVLIMVAWMRAERVEISGVHASLRCASVNPEEREAETGVGSRYRGEIVFGQVRQETFEFNEQLVDIAAETVRPGRPCDLREGISKGRQHRWRHLRQREELPPG